MRKLARLSLSRETLLRLDQERARLVQGGQSEVLCASHEPNCPGQQSRPCVSRDCETLLCVSYEPSCPPTECWTCPC